MEKTFKFLSSRNWNFDAYFRLFLLWFESEMSPKVSCVKDLVARYWGLGSDWIMKALISSYWWINNLMALLRGGTQLEEVSTRSMPWKSTPFSHSPLSLSLILLSLSLIFLFCSLSASWLSWVKQLSHHALLPLYSVSPYIGSEEMESSDWNLWNYGPNKSFLP
jgi:hypothetical protein